jgi:hypothetical protein
MTKWMALILVTFGLAACSSAKKMEDKKGETAVTQESADAAKKAEAAKSSATAEGKVTCETKGDSRSIEIRAKDKGCELAYTKFGKEEVIASSASGSDHCKKISERIQTNLKSSGFTCK